MKITLCGATTAEQQMDWDLILSLAGHVVYCDPMVGENVGDENFRRLELVHFEKIAASDAIVVLNKDGVLHSPARRCVEYARMLGREIFWLETASTQGEGFLGQSVWRLPHLFMNGSGSFKNISYVPQARAYQEKENDVRATPIEG